MNKLFIVDDYIENQNIDDAINVNVSLKQEDFLINKIELEIKKDTYLEIEYNNLSKSKLDIVFNINENVSLSLFEKRIGEHIKIHYKYNLSDNSELNINKFNNVKSIKEMCVINLNGVNSKVDYSFKSICTGDEKYDLLVHHNQKNSVSNIYNAAVNIKEGKILFNVSAFIPKGIKGCVAEQNGRIINMNNNKCIINPNLYVEEADVIANHAAAIGKFSDEELFYMMSRGISYDSALNLLIKGFLLPNMNIREEKKEEINKIIDQYWR